MKAWSNAAAIRRCLSPRRFVSNIKCFDEYEEEEQRKRIQSTEFYDKHAAQRRYFYYIDLQGRLFLEDAQPKNIATCLKSSAFLKFFYSRLRLNTNKEHDDEYLASYPYYSPCGKESNYVKSAAIQTPWVFQDLVVTDSSRYELILQGGITNIFNPASVMMGSKTGRLYHALSLPKRDCFNIGLIKSHLAIQISQYIHLEEDGLVLHWNGMEYPVLEYEEVKIKS